MITSCTVSTFSSRLALWPCCPPGLRDDFFRLRFGGVGLCRSRLGGRLLLLLLRFDLYQASSACNDRTSSDNSNTCFCRDAMSSLSDNDRDLNCAKYKNFFLLCTRSEERRVGKECR